MGELGPPWSQFLSGGPDTVRMMEMRMGSGGPTQIFKEPEHLIKSGRD